MDKNNVCATKCLETELIQLRYWQHILNEDLKKKVFKIPVHVAFGSEAIVIALHNMMARDDQMALTHRNMAYNLARAGTLKCVYDEYMQLPSGLAKGILGSMNLTNPERGIVYSSSILGNNFSVACGLAMAKQVKGDAGIVIVTTGDGAMEEGGFYEALVTAKSQNLKLLIIVENNNHSMSSTIAQRRCNIAIDKMCEAVGAGYQKLTSNDVYEYAQVFAKIRKDIDTQSAPVCVEACSSLMNQHAGPTPGWPTDPMCVDIENGLVIRSSSEDPLYVLREKMGEEEFDKAVALVTSQGWN